MAGIVIAIGLFGWMVPPTAFAAGGLGLPHPDVMNQPGWWGSFDINNRAFAGFSVNSTGAASLSFYDRFGKRKASISLISGPGDRKGERHPSPASAEASFE
jgi:hypothetical protein